MKREKYFAAAYKLAPNKKKRIVCSWGGELQAVRGSAANHIIFDLHIREISSHVVSITIRQIGDIMQIIGHLFDAKKMK